MPFTTQQLLDRLKNAQPKQQLDFDDVDADELDAAADGLHGLFRFESKKEGLKANPALTLSPDHRAVVNNLAKGFNQRLSQAGIGLSRLPHGRWAPVPSERVTEGRLSGRWWLKTYWWGVRLSLDHPAVLTLVAAGGAAVSLLTASGLASWVAAIVGLALGILKAFDRGNGVRIYVTWVSAWWIIPR